eukprot:jgi/Chrpa1/23161/Chrysochromulina_OHIO_Genome00006965-RA
MRESVIDATPSPRLWDAPAESLLSAPVLLPPPEASAALAAAAVGSSSAALAAHAAAAPSAAAASVAGVNATPLLASRPLGERVEAGAWKLLVSVGNRCLMSEGMCS